MSYKLWSRFFILIVFLAVSLFGLFNYAIDPLWTFCHSNKFNNAQPGFNERQQKTNRAYFCGLKQYDTLILGSSRVTYINQHDFKPLKAFNYASVSMYPIEYKGWIDNAKKIKGKDFKTIIIGVDFWGSSNGAFAKKQIKTTPKPSTYLKTASSFAYRYKMLFSMDTFKRSTESIKHSKALGTTDYTRDNIKQTIRISKARKQQAVNTQISLYNNYFYGKGYHYNTKLKKFFAKLKKDNPNTKFIIFTTPISEQLFKILVKNGNIKDYKRWLKTLVESFGEVYNFMDINTITKNPNNYADLHHIYPQVGKFIANKIVGTKNSNLPKDFGIIINKNNLNEYFKLLDKQIEY